MFDATWATVPPLCVLCALGGLCVLVFFGFKHRDHRGHTELREDKKPIGWAAFCQTPRYANFRRSMRRALPS